MFVPFLPDARQVFQQASDTLLLGVALVPLLQNQIWAMFDVPLDEMVAQMVALMPGAVVAEKLFYSTLQKFLG